MHIDGDIDDRDHDRGAHHANHGTRHGHGTGRGRMWMLGGGGSRGLGIVVVMRAGGRGRLHVACEGGRWNRGRLPLAHRTGRREYSLQQLHAE